MQGNAVRNPEEAITHEHAEELSATATAENADENILPLQWENRYDVQRTAHDAQGASRNCIEKRGMKRRERKEFICNGGALLKSYELCAEFVEQNSSGNGRTDCRKSRLAEDQPAAIQFFVTSCPMTSSTTKKVSERH